MLFIFYFSGVNPAKGEKDDELLTTMVCCSALGVFSPIQKVVQPSKCFAFLLAVQVSVKKRAVLWFWSLGMN